MKTAVNQRKQLLFFTSAMCACALLVGCAPEPSTPSTTPQAAAPAVYAPVAAQPRGPVSVDVCGQPVTFERVPQRAVTHGINLIETMLALGLGDRLVGYGGLRDIHRLPADMQPLLAQVPDLSSLGMNMETLLHAEPDLVFSGWSYGFREGQVTPRRLAEFGIDSYVLSESCIRKVARERVSLEDTFHDMLSLGQIFDIEAHAQALVDAQRAELQHITQAVQTTTERPRVFVYDSGDDIPVTTGRFAMPHAMVEAAGGHNIFDDLSSSWMPGNWEDVIDRNPEWIVIVDNDYPTPDGKRQFLLNKPELADVPAIRERRFVMLDFAEGTPGPRNVAATRRIAHALHPDVVRTP